MLHGCSVAAATERDGAEGGADESPAARLFEEGRTLMVDGHFALACPKLEESQRLEPRLGTRLNIAFCHERLGKLASAWKGFREAATQARREGDTSREQFAVERAKALAPRVPWLEVRVAALGPARAQSGDAEDVTGAADGVAGDGARVESGAGSMPTILLDGAPLAASDLGQELPVDPGAHVVIATQGDEAPGSGAPRPGNAHRKEYFRTSVSLREAEHAGVTVPAPPARVAALTSEAEPRPATSFTSRLVYEIGAFAGYLYVDTRTSSLEDPASVRTVLTGQGGDSQLVSCASIVCDVPSIGSSDGLVVGVAGFVGYSVSERMHAGLRLLAGPQPGGGALVALGPSASFPLGDRFRASPSVFIGVASHVVSQSIFLATPVSGTSVDARVQGSIGLSWGLGAELGMTLLESASGSLVLQTTPLYLSGDNGWAWSLPLGAAYRWN